MKDLFEGIATLLWPVIVMVVLWQFRPAVASIIESAKSRKFTLKIGGQELTMEEANEQLAKEVADLRQQVAEVKNRVAGEADPVSETAAAGPAALSAPRILWVDDNPKGNSFLVEQIRAWGAEVDLAESTSAGLAAFAAQDYQAVISDMVRKEDGRVRDDAGMQLLLQIRQRNPGIPFFVFCSPRNARRWGAELKNAGAQGVTASETELLRLLQLEARKRYGMK